MIDYYRLFPIQITVADDDLGSVMESISDSCEAATESDYVGVSHAPGRGTFTQNGILPGVAISRSSATENGVPDTKNGVASVHFWAANKPTFINSGQCEIGIVQIVKTSVDYEGVLGIPTELVHNRDWHVDGSVPYLFPFLDPTHDNPLSKGMLSAQDSPGLEPVVSGAALLSGTQEFETCVVAMPNGSDAMLGEIGNVEYLKGMAVYGCVSWFSEITRVGDGTYVQRYGVMDDVRISQRTDLDNPVATYEGDGVAPSEVFASLIRSHFVTGDD
jgi:hypothetical protein